jgi:hypothetical protein
MCEYSMVLLPPLNFHTLNFNSRDAETSDMCTADYILCQQEADPERYCVNTDDPVFCKTVGNICDVGGFVRPEYPYCK